MEFNEKLLFLEDRYLEYKSKSILGYKKQKQMTFSDYVTAFFVDDTQSLNMTDEMELIDECKNGN